MSGIGVDVRLGVLVGGVWGGGGGSGEVHRVVNPATEGEIAVVAGGSLGDVDRAVAAARSALPGWSATPVAERAGALRRLAQAIDGDKAGLADTITSEVGTPRRVAELIQVGLPVYEVAQMADIVEAFPFEERVRNSLVVRDPIGVVAAITPWNYPLHQITAKLAPALAAGCTVVVKPSEVAPLAALRLAELLDEAGVPAGVVNVVLGTGPIVGEALAAHRGVDMVSFTGSTRAGRRVGELAAAGIKRVALELGGKSANVVLDDADLERAVTTGVRRAFVNGGQTCSALSRMVVPAGRLAEAEEIAAAAAATFVAGDPFDPATTLGPMVTRAQRDRVVGHIDGAVAGGARCVTGGRAAPDGLDRGWFVRPTVFSDVDRRSALAQEEVFGPVLALLASRDDDDAVAIANDSAYGLAGAVWSGDPDRALRVARRLHTGQVEVNGGAFNAIAPFGGVKASGNGREGGRFGLEEHLELKSLQL